VSDPFSAEGVARQLDYCTYCPKMCRHLCPVSTASGRETLIPQAKMDRLNRLRRGLEPWTADAAEPLYACTGCRQCTTACLHGNEPGLVLMSGRAAAVARGAGHPALAGYPERFRAREARLTADARNELPTGQVGADVAVVPGCDALDKSPRDARATLDLLERAGVAAELTAGRVACAGYPLLAAGHPDVFRWHATRVAAALKGFRTAVVGCSACVYTMRVSYPAEGVTLGCEVVSLAEMLVRTPGRLGNTPRPSATREKKTVYYHDPCYLARYAGVTDEPRRVLGEVAEVAEFAWSRGDTECCGGAGLLPKTMPEIADAMARRRLKDVSARGGGVVVTSCGTCAHMLRRNAPTGVEVRDLPSALIEAVAGASDDGDIPPQPV
jgi:Fe-S oxidoreductase